MYITQWDFKHSLEYKLLVEIAPIGVKRGEPKGALYPEKNIGRAFQCIPE